MHKRPLLRVGGTGTPVSGACLSTLCHAHRSLGHVGPFRRVSKSLYAETRRLLESLDRAQAGGKASWTTSGKVIPVEHIQVLLLLAHYELLCVGEHEAMLTAGRVFRLAQMARLYEVDKREVSPITADVFAEAEEKRRAFWLAFGLDRFLCSRDELP